VSKKSQTPRHVQPSVSLSRKPEASSDCHNTIFQFFPPCQNKFTNKHGRYIIKPSLCTIDGQKIKFVGFCPFFTILGSGVFARRRGKCDNLKIKLSLATPWKHTFPKSKQNGLGLLPPNTHTHTHNIQISVRSFCPFLILWAIAPVQFLNFMPGDFTPCCGGTITSSNIIHIHTIQKLEPEVLEPEAEEPGRREGKVAPRKNTIFKVESPRCGRVVHILLALTRWLVWPQRNSGRFSTREIFLRLGFKLRSIQTVA
jgi:hypothetical protein